MHITIVGAAALACAAVFVSYGLTPEAVELVAFTALLAAMAAIDFDSRRIPNVLVIAAALVRVAYLGFIAMTASAAEFSSLLISSLVGGIGVGLALILFIAITGGFSENGGGMGAGDIKLLSVAGFYFGWYQGMLVAVLACAFGVVAGFVSSWRAEPDLPFKDRLAHAFPLGPCIALACLVVMIMASPLFHQLF